MSRSLRKRKSSPASRWPDILTRVSKSAYVLEGGLDLPIEGQPTRAVKPGDAFVVPANTPHAGSKNGDKKTRIVSTYVVEKGKPLASPA